MWLQLESPPADGLFPYHLALRRADTGSLVTSGTVRGDETYDLVLTRDAAMQPAAVAHRFVYVFSIDSSGRRVLLFPYQNAGAVENRLPVALENGGWPDSITLQQFDIAAPYGVDTFVMLTSDTQLPDPAVLNDEPVRGIASHGGDPLIRLLLGNQSRERGISSPVPANWTIERLAVISRPPATPH
jgi:hypothetical protein